MSHTIDNFDNYINQHKKIFIHQLNSNPYVKPKLNKKKQNLDDVDNEDELIEMNDINYEFNEMEMEKSNIVVGDENYKLYHLNISHLDSNNSWIGDNHYYYSEHKETYFVKHHKLRYLDQSNGLKKNEDKDKYKIISETCKI